MSTKSQYLASDILQIISDLRGETAVNSDAVRLRAIDRAARDFSTRRFWKVYKLINQTTTSTAAGDYEIGSATFPMRPKGLSEVFSGGTLESNRYKILDEHDFLVSYNADTSDLLAYEWYDAANDKWMMHLSPDTSGNTITYSYYWTSPTVSATSSKVYTPDPDIVARRALAYIYEGEDEDKYVTQYQLSEQMAEAWDEIEDQPNFNQTYTVASYTDDGIGSY